MNTQSQNSNSLKAGLILAFALVSVAGVRAENAESLEQPVIEARMEYVAPAPKTSAPMTLFLGAPARLEKTPTIHYGGLVTDIINSRDRLHMFSLRKPLDLKRDGENLLDAHSKVGPAIRIFSISFK